MNEALLWERRVSFSVKRITYEFSEVSEGEKKHAGVNSCREECDDARANSVQAGVGNQQDNRNDIGVQLFIKSLLRNFLWKS